MKTFLHVGCGAKRKANTTPGFKTDEWAEIRLDIDPSVKPDVIGTMTDLSALSSETVDAIYSSHNIEHLYPHEVPVALSEFLRVLKHDGFLIVTCPDLKSVAQLVAADKLTEPAYKSGMGPIAPLDIIYGHRASLAKGNLYMAHRCGFTERVLNRTLVSAGFKSLATQSRPKVFALWAAASKSQRSETEMRVVAQHYFGQ